MRSVLLAVVAAVLVRQEAEGVHTAKDEVVRKEILADLEVRGEPLVVDAAAELTQVARVDVQGAGCQTDNLYEASMQAGAAPPDDVLPVHFLANMPACYVITDDARLEEMETRREAAQTPTADSHDAPRKQKPSKIFGFSRKKPPAVQSVSPRASLPRDSCYEKSRNYTMEAIRGRKTPKERVATRLARYEEQAAKLGDWAKTVCTNTCQPCTTANGEEGVAYCFFFPVTHAGVTHHVKGVLRTEREGYGADTRVLLRGKCYNLCECVLPERVPPLNEDSGMVDPTFKTRFEERDGELYLSK